MTRDHRGRGAARPATRTSSGRTGHDVAVAPRTRPRAGWSSRRAPEPIRRRRPATRSRGPAEPAAQVLVAPTKPPTNVVAGVPVDVQRRRILLDPPGVHHRNPVGDRQRLVLVVGDEHRGDPEALLDLADVLAHADPQLGVEVGQRLVEEEDLAARCTSARARATRCCSPPEMRAGREPDVVRQPDQLEDALDPLCDLRLRHLAQPEPERDVVEHRHVRPQRVVLEHHRRRAPLGRQVGHVACRR